MALKTNGDSIRPKKPLQLSRRHNDEVGLNEMRYNYNNVTYTHIFKY